MFRTDYIEPFSNFSFVKNEKKNGISRLKTLEEGGVTRVNIRPTHTKRAHLLTLLAHVIILGIAQQHCHCLFDCQCSFLMSYRNIKTTEGNQ